MDKAALIALISPVRVRVFVPEPETATPAVSVADRTPELTLSETVTLAEPESTSATLRFLP